MKRFLDITNLPAPMQEHLSEIISDSAGLKSLYLANLTMLKDKFPERGEYESWYEYWAFRLAMIGYGNGTANIYFEGAIIEPKEITIKIDPDYGS